MDSMAWTFVDKIHQHGGGLGGGVRIPGRETEFVFRAELLEVLQAVDEHKGSACTGRGFLAGPVLQVLRKAAHDFSEIAAPGLGDGVRDGLNDAVQELALRRAGRRAVEQN